MFNKTIDYNSFNNNDNSFDIKHYDAKSEY